jgi:diguanylate cyclase
LPNRRQLEEDLAGSLSELSDQGRNAVVAMLDIDFFKRLNDDFGHQVGDVALRRIAGVLRTSVRDNDQVYRFGGEEFVVVFIDTTLSEATVLAERLRSSVAAVLIQGSNDEPVGPITVSIGLALLPEHGDDVRKLIDLADKAMYQAKVNGRNRIEVWNGSNQSGSLTEVA